MVTRAYWYIYSIICILAVLKMCRAGDDLLGSPVSIEVYSFDNCPSEEPFAISFENLTMRMDFQTKKLHVSGLLDMKVPWTVNIMTHLKLSKCLVKDDDNSCNKYFETDMNDMCKHMPEKGKQWSPFVSAVKDFHPYCPVKAGVYDVLDAPVDTNLLEHMQAVIGIWNLGFTAWEGDRVLMCTSAGFEIKRARRSKKKLAF